MLRRSAAGSGLILANSTGSSGRNITVETTEELKASRFKPEHAGKLNFYLSAVDDLLRHPDDKPTIGILLCRSRNRVIAEYALRGLSQPLGVSEYELTKALPEELAKELPSIEALESEFEDSSEGRD